MGIRQAADRLRHDLGKAIRFSAPEGLERDTEALRVRLHADVVTTRRGGGASRSAPEIFRAWLAAEGRAFRDGALAGRLAEIERAVDEIRDLASRLDALPRSDLERLDALTREVASGCRLLAGEARGLDGPS